LFPTLRLPSVSPIPTPSCRLSYALCSRDCFRRPRPSCLLSAPFSRPQLLTLRRLHATHWAVGRSMRGRLGCSSRCRGSGSSTCSRPRTRAMRRQRRKPGPPLYLGCCMHCVTSVTVPRCILGVACIAWDMVVSRRTIQPLIQPYGCIEEDYTTIAYPRRPCMSYVICLYRGGQIPRCCVLRVESHVNH
jgi:hypothetical protein